MSDRSSVISELRAAKSAAKSAVNDALKILALETRMAAISLAVIIGLGLVLAIFITAAWGLLWAAAITKLIELGLAWHWVLLISAAVQLLMVAICGWLIVRFSRNLQFSASRRVVAGSDHRRDAPDR